VGYCTPDTNNLQAMVGFKWVFEADEPETKVCKRKSAGGLLGGAQVSLTTIGVVPLGPTGLNAYLVLSGGLPNYKGTLKGFFSVGLQLLAKLPGSTTVPFTSWNLTPMCARITALVAKLSELGEWITGKAGKGGKTLLTVVAFEAIFIGIIAFLRNPAKLWNALKDFFQILSTEHPDITDWVTRIFDAANPFTEGIKSFQALAKEALKAATGVKWYIGADNYFRIDWKRTWEYNDFWSRSLGEGDNGFSLSQEKVNTVAFGFDAEGSPAAAMAVGAATGGLLPSFSCGFYNTAGAEMACTEGA